MKTFKDTQGREWVIKITVGVIETLREKVKVDIYSLFTDEAKRLFSDPVLLVNTLYVLCKRQCDDRKMSDVDFGESFDGDVLEAAAEALLEEVVNFSPTSRQKILRATISKSKILMAGAEEHALAKIAALTVTDLFTPIESPAS